MSNPSSPRVQFVISGKFIFLLLLASSLLGGGYYWYNRRLEDEQRFSQIQERFKAPPYFVNRGPTVTRSCQHCLEQAGKLKPQGSWKVLGPQEIPATEQRWFLAVENPPMPVTVAGVLMLPVHPSFQDNPSFGFDQTHVLLVLYQNLERKAAIEQPTPTPPPPPPEPPKPSPTQPDTDADAGTSRTAGDDAFFKLNSPFVGDWRNVDPNTRDLTRILITGQNELAVHVWGRCHPTDCDWGEAQRRAALPPADGSFGVGWDLKFALCSLELSLDSGRLRALLRTHFTDQSGRRDYETVSFFSRLPETP